MIYNQESVPIEIWQKFPSLRDKPPQQQQQAASTSVQSQQPQILPLDTLKDMFPDLSQIQKQSICQTNSQYIPAYNNSQILTTQSAWNSIHDSRYPSNSLVVSNNNLRKKEYAPETLPMNTQITMNKNTCSLCARSKKHCQFGDAGDGTISHITPIHMMLKEQ